MAAYLFYIIFFSAYLILHPVSANNHNRQNVSNTCELYWVCDIFGRFVESYATDYCPKVSCIVTSNLPYYDTCIGKGIVSTKNGFKGTVSFTAQKSVMTSSKNFLHER